MISRSCFHFSRVLQRGQKLTVYTQLLHKPLASQQRHLIILDNGRRSRVRNSPLKESLYCIRCGACLNACPVFRELGGHAYIGSDLSIAPYPGPIGSVISPEACSEKIMSRLAQASSLCGACKDACPVDIDLPKLLTRVRAGYSTQPTSGDGKGLSLSTRFGLQLFARIATHPKLYAASQKFAALGSLSLRPILAVDSSARIYRLGVTARTFKICGRTFRERYGE